MNSLAEKSHTNRSRALAIRQSSSESGYDRNSEKSGLDPSSAQDQAFAKTGNQVSYFPKTPYSKYHLELNQCYLYYFLENRHDLSDLSGRFPKSQAQSSRDKLIKHQVRVQKSHVAEINLSNTSNLLIPRNEDEISDWRLRERMKTVSVALCLCLNLGVDPPDYIKPSPRARIQAWYDPVNNIAISTNHQLHRGNGTELDTEDTQGITGQQQQTSNGNQKTMNYIANNLQSQYELWQPRARYKYLLDPTAEELKKLLTTLRRSSKDDRVLFHYNGHGVPKPTKGGEIWVFNKSFTQYIPVSIYDVQAWVGEPGIYVWDCSNASAIVSAFNKFAKQRDAGKKDVKPGYLFGDCIHFAACSENEELPSDPIFPADIFSSCLTTPIEMSLRWYFVRNQKWISSDITMEMITRIPGKINDRRTPLGELNWIFTAIMDTIAWTCLPRKKFKLLFRQDLMVAALFRNFLLASRIMRSLNCTPLSHPCLSTESLYGPNGFYQHQLWKSWDLAVDMCIIQLPKIMCSDPYSNFQIYRSSTFFSEQLTAFEVWLEKAVPYRSVLDSHSPPPQLPIVLQVLLSQTHRLRALVLLCQFLDLGPWAVHQALSVGIFPYVLKLLQSPAQDLKLVLVFIWSRIVAVDPDCRSDLIKENGYMYFVNILVKKTASIQGKKSTKNTNGSALIEQNQNVSELQAMSLFVLTAFCHRSPLARQLVVHSPLFLMPKKNDNTQEPSIRDSIIFEYFESDDSLLRQWAIICWGSITSNLKSEIQVPTKGSDSNLSSATTTSKAQKYASKIPEIPISIFDDEYMLKKPLKLLSDDVPEVRAAAIHALGMWLSRSKVEIIPGKEVYNADNSSDQILCQQDFRLRLEQNVCLSMLVCVADASPLVRSELVVSLSNAAHIQVQKFIDYAFFYLEEEKLKTKAFSKKISPSFTSTSSPGSFKENSLADRFYRSSINHHSFYSCIWKVLLNMCMDPVDIVANLANQVVDYVNYHMLLKRGDQVLEFIKPPAPKSSSSKSSLNFGTLTSSPRFPYISTNSSLPSNYASNSSKSNLESPTESPKEIPELPLKSNFFNWAGKFFMEPRLRPSDDEMPGGLSFIERSWRRQKNEKEILRNRPIIRESFRDKMDHRICTLNQPAEMTRCLLFHPFDPYLVAADDSNFITVWNWGGVGAIPQTGGHGRRISHRFKNGNMRGSHITSIKWVNEQDKAILISGSDDGIIRVFKDWEDNEKFSMITAWRGIPELLPDETGSGLVMHWQQNRGTLILSGDVKTIRFWDIDHELCISEIPTRSSNCVTSLCDDKALGNIIYAGLGDGSISVHDRRKSSKESLVQKAVHHNSWIVGLHHQAGADGLLLSTSSDGIVNSWDQRMFKKPTGAFLVDDMGQISCSDLHEFAPLLAVGSDLQYLKVFNLHGKSLPAAPPTTIRYHEGFLGQRISPVSSIAFHPQSAVLASGGHDQLISLYSTRAAYARPNV